jgi:hypothetical protein
MGLLSNRSKVSRHARVTSRVRHQGSGEVEILPGPNWIDAEAGKLVAGKVVEREGIGASIYVTTPKGPGR